MADWPYGRTNTIQYTIIMYLSFYYVCFGADASRAFTTCRNDQTVSFYSFCCRLLAVAGADDVLAGFCFAIVIRFIII